MKEVNKSITCAKAQRDREETPCRLRTANGFQSIGVGEQAGGRTLEVITETGEVSRAEDHVGDRPCATLR